jgi:hypothetical protein
MITRRVFTLAVAAVAVSGCSRAGSNDDAFRWTQPMQPGAVVHILDGSGNVTVHRAAGNEVVVSGSTRWRRGRESDIHFAVTRAGNDYYVCAMWRSSGRCGARGYRGARSGGFLAMFSLFHRSSDAVANMVVEVPPGIAVDGQATNGSVDADGVTGGIRAHTLNGNVRATNVSGPLSLKTMNGDVHLSTDSLAPSDSISVETMNGGIFADLPATVQGAFDLRVTNGSVHSDFTPSGGPSTVTRGHLVAQIGSSNRVVRMRTMNGNVTVTARGAPSSH